MDTGISILSECPLFQNVGPETVRKLLNDSASVTREYRKGETVCRTGEPFDNLSFIISGCLELRKYLSTGNAVSVFHRSRGEMIGGCNIFSVHPVSPYDILAAEDSRLLLICKSSVLKVLFRNTDVAENMMRIYADRLSQFQKRLELFSYSSIRQKIAFSLLNDFQAENGSTVQLPFSKTVWAEYMNVSRTSLSRELAGLCRLGIIEVHGRRIGILTKELLESLLF